jgi:3-deoxy-D-arabino-heptulosonate 7-phosphate (DAHP) synthase class II
MQLTNTDNEKLNVMLNVSTWKKFAVAVTTHAKITMIRMARVSAQFRKTKVCIMILSTQR